MLGWNVDLGFDVGTCTTRLYQRGVGLVASEPTAVAFTTASGEVAAFGAEAKLLGEQASSGVRVVFPVRAGVVADHQATAELLRGMMRRVLGRRALFLPRALVAVNTDATPVERAALQHAVQSAGAREVRLVDGTLAGAIGAGLVATDRSARLVVGLGGGSTTFGLVAQGRLVWGRSLRFGGVDLDEAVRKLMRNRYGLAISAPTAERMKLQVAAVSSQMARTKVTLGGNEVYGELFRNLEVTLDAIPDTLARALLPVVNEIHWAIAEATTEQRAEVRANGVLLLGGTSQLQGLTQMIRDKLGVPVVRAREPAHAVALGLGAMLQDVVKLSPDGNRYGSIG